MPTPAGELLAQGVRFDVGVCRCGARSLIIEGLCCDCHYLAIEAAAARAFCGLLHGANSSYRRQPAVACDLAQGNSRRQSTPSSSFAAWITASARFITVLSNVESRKLPASDWLNCGRWLAIEHPGIQEPAAWNRELCAAYVAAVDRMRVGDYAQRRDPIRERLGTPLSPRSKEAYLGAMRQFFRDVQEWGWIPRRFEG